MPSLYLPPSRMVSRTPKGNQVGVMQVSTDSMSFIWISQLAPAVPIRPEETGQPYVKLSAPFFLHYRLRRHTPKILFLYCFRASFAGS